MSLRSLASVSALLPALPMAALAGAAGRPPPVAKSCYLLEFREKGFPWRADDCLNYEEVFKNLLYWESSLDWPKRLLVMRRYERGQLTETLRFLLDEKNGLKRE